MILSIITINRNNAIGLEKTIRSVSCQTFTDFEYIIIDGKSTDGSIECITENSKFITNWLSESDTGIYNAMNKGLMKASGKYCLFLNSGDVLHSSNVLENFFLHKFDQDIVYGDLSYTKNDMNEGVCVYPDVIDFDYLYHFSLPHPATVIKRSLLQKQGGYNEQLKYVSDWVFFIDAIFLYNCSYKHIPVILSDFDIDGVSNSHSHQEAISVERKVYLDNKYKNLSLSIDEQDNNMLISYAKKHRKSKFLLMCIKTHKLLIDIRTLFIRT